MRRILLTVYLTFLLSTITSCGGGGGNDSKSDVGKNALAAGQSVNPPAALVDKQGVRTVYWSDHNSDGTFSVYMRQSSGGAWSDPTTVLNHTDAWTNLTISPTENGHLIAAIMIPTSANSPTGPGIIYVSRFSPATGWSALETVADVTTFLWDFRVVEDSLGNITVAWSQAVNANGGPLILWTSQLPAGGSWGIPVQQGGISNNFDNIHLIAYKPGGVLLIWGMGNYARYDGSWIPSTTIATTIYSNVSVASNDNGTVVVTWKSLDLIYSSLYTDATGWQPEEQISFDAFPKTVRKGPVIAINNNEDELVLWQSDTDDPLYEKIEASYKAAGLSWSTPELLLDNVFNADLQNIFLDDDQNGLAVRQKYNTYIVDSTFSPTTGWSKEQTLYTSVDGLNQPSVAMNATGHGIIAWRDIVSNSFYIQARLLP